MGVFVATVSRIERLRNSTNGNPRCRVFFEGDAKSWTVAETAPDATTAFNVIDNHSAPDRTDYGLPLRITTDEKGLIVSAESVPPEETVGVYVKHAATVELGDVVQRSQDGRQGTVYERAGGAVTIDWGGGYRTKFFPKELRDGALRRVPPID